MLIVHVKNKDDIVINYIDIAKDVQTRFDTRPTIAYMKKLKVTGLMKNELGGKIMKKFVGLKTKTYSYLKDNNDEDKEAKGKKSVS